jgi:phosphatidylinositol glycan class N
LLKINFSNREYIENVLLVDRIVEKISLMLEEFYSNENHLTSFIFTADHGMTDWGSHGSGDNTERLTPFISWGAGIQRKLDLYKFNFNFILTMFF